MYTTHKQRQQNANRQKKTTNYNTASNALDSMASCAAAAVY